MTKNKNQNPLQKPLQSLLKHAERVMSIPGFDSDTLKKGVEGARQALGVKNKTTLKQ